MVHFLQVVGYEGLLGSIALFAILMPIVQFIPGKDGEGLHEDSLESIHMVILACSSFSAWGCMLSVGMSRGYAHAEHGPIDTHIGQGCMAMEQSRLAAGHSLANYSRPHIFLDTFNKSGLFCGPVQITHSLPPWAIPAVLAANSISLLLYNVAGMFVTDELGALSRTVFESARTLFVWLVRAAPQSYREDGTSTTIPSHVELCMVA